MTVEYQLETATGIALIRAGGAVVTDDDVNAPRDEPGI